MTATMRFAPHPNDTNNTVAFAMLNDGFLNNIQCRPDNVILLGARLIPNKLQRSQGQTLHVPQKVAGSRNTQFHAEFPPRAR